MELDWCAFCGKRSPEGRLYCTDACAAADAARAEAPKFDMRHPSNVMNDFAEASERHLEGTKPNEPIPKLSELRKKKGKGAPGLGGGPNLGMGGAGPGNPTNARIGGADDMDMATTTDGDSLAERERSRAVDESKEFLRAYQRRRTWATASTAAAPDMAATAPTPGMAAPPGAPAGAASAHGSSGSLLTAALTTPRSSDRPPDPPFMSMSTPVKSTELDPAVFKKRKPGAQYTYGVDTQRYQRDQAYAEELMKESWYNNDG